MVKDADACARPQLVDHGGDGVGAADGGRTRVELRPQAQARREEAAGGPGRVGPSQEDGVIDVARSSRAVAALLMRQVRRVVHLDRAGEAVIPKAGAAWGAWARPHVPYARVRAGVMGLGTDDAWDPGVVRIGQALAEVVEVAAHLGSAVADDCARDALGECSVEGAGGGAEAGLLVGNAVTGVAG